MIHFPILRWGNPYTSLELSKVVHFDTGEAIADTPRLVLPEDVDDLFVSQSGSEYKATRGRKTVWLRRGPSDPDQRP